MRQPIRVLLVEDDPNDAEMVLHALRCAGFEPEWSRVDTEVDYLAQLAGQPDVILSDHALPAFGGPRALELLKASGLDVPFISVSGTIGEEVAVQAMRHGVADYLLKNNLLRLGSAVTRVLKETRLRRERQQLEEQCRQTQKLEAVGQLAGGVAHDFNNILTVIQGYATLLEQGLIDNLECAKEISFAVERAAGLSRQLLSLTRKQALQPTLINLNEVVEDMTKLLRRSLGPAVALEFSPADALPEISADRGMIEQILLNLALNARDAMPEGGRLLIATRVSSLDAATDLEGTARSAGPAVTLRIADTGAGMSPDVRAQIFEPFFTTKSANKGTGLGLSTVRGIVQQHLGEIHVHSELGKGTAFEILLPATGTKAERTRVAEESPVDRQEAGKRVTILLVDDEPALRSMMRMALKHFGYDVLEASSGQQALAIFERSTTPIHLLLTDMVMPEDVGGEELAERMRAGRPGLRVLYTSGYHVDTIRRDLVAKGEIAFLQKPFSMQKLAEAVGETLQAAPSWA